MNKEFRKNDSYFATSAEDSSNGEQTESDDVSEVEGRKYSEIKAEKELYKRFDSLLHQVETMAQSLDLGSYAAKPTKDSGQSTLQSDSVVTHFNTTPSYIVNTKLRDFQLDGLNWLILLYENGVNGILGDEMGLGKTLQVIALLGYVKNYCESDVRHLLIVPNLILVAHWKNEIEKFCPSVRILCFVGTKRERSTIKRKKFKLEKWDVCLTTYGTAYFERKHLRQCQWCYIIIDESGKMKNDCNTYSSNFRLLKSKHRLLISGTPLQNNVHDLWSLLNFLHPNVFGNSDDFDKLFCTKTCLENDTLVQRLYAIVKLFLLRRLKSEVEKGIPPMKIIKLYASMTKLQKEEYAQILAKDINSFGSAIDGSGPLWLMRKCCNHPYALPGVEPGPPYTTDIHLVNNCGKMRVLDKLLFFLRDQGSRVLIFTQFTYMLDILEDYVKWRKFSFCRMDGKTTLKNCNIQLQSFNRPDSNKFIFLLTTRAGSLGINLCTADSVIFYDTDWNPQIDLQAMSRAHRIGQTKTVRVFILITENSIEEKMNEIAVIKMRLANIVIEQGRRKDLSHTSKISGDMIAKFTRHEADHILATKDTDVTDENIESILERSEKKTQEMQSKIDAMKESTLTSFSSFLPNDYQNNLEDTGLEHLTHLSEQNSTASYEINSESRNRQIESRGNNPLKRVHSDSPEGDPDTGLKSSPQKHYPASFSFGSDGGNLETLKEKTKDREPEKKRPRRQKSNEPTSLKIPLNQGGKKKKTPKKATKSKEHLHKPIKISETESASTKADTSTFSSLSDICMFQLKKVVQTAIQFQRHSHSRRLCSSHFSNALTAHGFHFESDFFEDFLDFCSPES